MTEDKRKDIMRRVQKLLNKAESTPYGPEQLALLEKSDKLMVEYAINEHELKAQGGFSESTKPEKFSFPVCGENTHIWYELTNLCQDVVRFFGGRAVYSGLHGKGKWAITARGVAFPEQIKAIEMLFTSLKIQLLTTINPSWSLTLSLEDNIVKMKDAGMTWSNIYVQLNKGGVDWAQEPETRNLLGKTKRIYDNRKIALCEEPVKVNPKNYQRNFSIGFESKISTRLYEIKLAREKEQEQNETSDGTSVALVLRSKSDAVQQAMDEAFPTRSRGVSGSQAKVDHNARQAGSQAGGRADLSGAQGSVKGSNRAIGG